MIEHDRPLKVCFVAMHAYAVLNPKFRGAVGGMESRAVLFAKGLARRPGFDVSLLTGDFGQPEGERFAGVRVFVYPFLGSWRWDALRRRQLQHVEDVRTCLRPGDQPAWRRIRRVTPQLPYDAAMGLVLSRALKMGGSALRLWSVYGRATPLFRAIDADVVVTFGVNDISADAIASARRYGKKSVLALAHDWNLLPSYRRGSWEFDFEGSRMGACWYALHHADVVVAQTDEQRRLLKERFGRDATVIRNPLPLDAADPRSEPGEHFLWIGRANEAKRPLALVELARRCPELPFVMIMNPLDEAIERQVRAQLPANIRLIDRVPADEMAPWFVGARALVSTSRAEGMPNTFLQAGRYRRPVLSLAIDPDEMLRRSGGGIVADDSVDTMAEHARRLAAHADEAQTMGTRLHDYVRQFHEAEARVDDVERLLRRLAAA